MIDRSECFSFYFDPTYEDEDMIFCYQCELPILDRPIFHKWDFEKEVSFCCECCRDEYFEENPDHDWIFEEAYLDSLDIENIT